MIDKLVGDRLAWSLDDALGVWKPLFDGTSRIARPVFAWEREVLT